MRDMRPNQLEQEVTSSEPKVEKTGFVKRNFKRLSDLGEDYIRSGRYNIQDQDTLTEKAVKYAGKHTALTAMGLYWGDLLPGIQTEKARELGLEDSVFSKYSSTAGHVIYSLPRLMALAGSKFSETSGDDNSILIEMAIGAGIDLGRIISAYGFNKPTPSIGVKPFLVNLVHNAKDIKQSIQEKGVKESLRLAKEKADDTLLYAGVNLENTESQLEDKAADWLAQNIGKYKGKIRDYFSRIDNVTQDEPGLRVSTPEGKVMLRA